MIKKGPFWVFFNHIPSKATLLSCGLSFNKHRLIISLQLTGF